MRKIHWFSSGAWPCFIGFTTNARAVERFMPGMPLVCSENATASTRLLDKPDGDCCILITAVPVSKRIAWEVYAAMIAHEAVHVVQYLKEQYSPNEPLGYETEAYLVQYITQECLQKAYKTGRVMRVIP